MTTDNPPPTPGQRIAGEFTWWLTSRHRLHLGVLIDAEIAGLQTLIRSLAERCEGQSELLSKRAEVKPQ